MKRKTTTQKHTVEHVMSYLGFSAVEEGAWSKTIQISENEKVSFLADVSMYRAVSVTIASQMCIDGYWHKFDEQSKTYRKRKNGTLFIGMDEFLYDMLDSIATAQKDWDSENMIKLRDGMKKKVQFETTIQNFRNEHKISIERNPYGSTFLVRVPEDIDEDLFMQLLSNKHFIKASIDMKKVVDTFIAVKRL